jgi:ammonium transporter, Amt family
MTVNKPTRATLMTLICGFLIAAFVTTIFVNTSFAQTQAPAAAAPAAAPAEPPPPACDAKTLEKCTPNSGDTAWMLTSMALVLMMTVPGLGLFYGGMVRRKNVGDTVMTSFAIT